MEADLRRCMLISDCSFALRRQAVHQQSLETVEGDGMRA
jgi:hypothetical protein